MSSISFNEVFHTLTYDQILLYSVTCYTIEIRPLHKNSSHRRFNTSGSVSLTFVVQNFKKNSSTCLKFVFTNFGRLNFVECSHNYAQSHL